jgi:hypothetical protein
MSNLLVTTNWVNLFDATSVTSGSMRMLLQNKGSGILVINFSDISPEEADTDGLQLYPNQHITIPTNVTTAFIRSYNNPFHCYMFYGNADEVSINDLMIPTDIYTTDQLGIRRLAVDAQQTSFEENTQFKYFDELVDIAYGSQVVYKITLTNPINLFLRKLSLYTGGRKYRVYPASQVTFTGTLTNSGIISPMNQNLSKYNTTHPVTGLTIQRSVGSGIITTTGNPLDGLDVLTDGNANRASSEFDAEGERQGYSGDQIVYVILNPLGGNGVSSGFYKLIWEERFNG